MAVAYSDAVSYYTSFADLTSIDSPEIAVASGNLVVAIAFCVLHTDAPTFTDTAGNSFSNLALFNNAAGYMQIGYVFATNADATDVVTATWDAAEGGDAHGIAVIVATKDAGATWSYDGVSADGGGDFSSAIVSGTIGIEDNSIALGLMWCGASRTISSPTIGGSAATSAYSAERLIGCYREVATAEAAKTFAATLVGGDTWWNAFALSFSATGGGGGGSIVPLVMAHYRRLRNG